MPHFVFFFSSRRRHTRLQGDWSSDVCSSDLRLVDLTFSCEIEIDPRGKFVDRKIYKSVIRTRERMTYTDVNAIQIGRASCRERVTASVECDLFYSLPMMAA